MSDSSLDPQEPQEQGKPIVPLMIPGRDEMNLAEFPFASLRTVRDSRNIITYEGWTVDKDGKPQKQKWEVTGSTKAGLPTEFDERVFVALLAITAAEGFNSQKVPFAVYQVLKIMGLGDRKSDYEKVERSLDRLVGVTIYAEGAFWDNQRKARVKVKTGFHLIEKYWLSYQEEDEETREREGVQAYVIWSSDIWESIEAGYIKRLDLNLFYALERPLARRLYRFLDKRMQFRAEFEIDIFELSGRLGMTEYTKPSHIKRKLQPAIDELIAYRYLESAETVKVQKYTRFRFRRTEASFGEESLLPNGNAGAGKVAPEEAPSPEEAAVVALLAAGLTKKVATQLVEEFPVERIHEKLEYLAWLRRNGGRKIKNPAGWLRQAIEQDYSAPEGFQKVLQTDFFSETESESSVEEGSKMAPRTWEERVTAKLAISDECRQMTRDLHSELQHEMTRATYETWVKHTLIAEVTGQQVRIAVPSQQAFEWLNHRLRASFESVLARRIGEGMTVEFVVGEG